MRRPLFIRLLLIFALLFSQFGGLAHCITHALSENQHDSSLPHDRLCNLCASYTQLGGTLNTHVAQFIPIKPTATYTANSPRTAFHSTAPHSFSARAPPRSA